MGGFRGGLSDKVEYVSNYKLINFGISALEFAFTGYGSLLVGYHYES